MQNIDSHDLKHFQQIFVLFNLWLQWVCVHVCARILGAYRLYFIYISVVKTEPMSSSEIATTTTTDGSLDNFSGSGKE